MSLLKSLITISIALSIGIHASGIDADTCLIQGKVIDLPQDADKNLRIKILSTDSDDCPVKNTDIYEVTNNTPGIFKENTTLSASVRKGTSMGPNGVVNFLLWSDVTESGKTPTGEYEFQSGVLPSLALQEKAPEEAKNNYEKYLISLAGLVVLMVIASSISQIQKYRQK